MPDEIVFRRVRTMGDGERLAEDGKIRLLASTSDPVDWGGWREVLSHEDGAVDMSAARSLLINHDPDQLAGGISAMALDGRVMSSDADIDEDARMRSGVSVRKSVAKRRLNGVSIGYTYSRDNTYFDEATRTLTVRKWRLLEISLTPIPADGRAQVRSFPFDQPDAVVDHTSSKPLAAIPAVSQEARVSEPINSPKPQGNEAAATPNHSNDEGARAAVIAEQREIAVQAKSLGLDAGDYVGLSRDDSQKAMLRALADKNKTKVPEAPIGGSTVNYDQADKARDAFTGALAHQAGFKGERAGAELAKLQEGNNLMGQGFNHAVRKYAQLMGHDTQDWTRKDTALFALGRPQEMSRGARAAAVTSADFQGFVFLNAMTKIVAKGFEMGSATARYRRLVSTQNVPDFKQFSIGGISSGNFQQTAENVAFPELDKSEGVYNSKAKMWGGTISLTMQAMINDDTSSFNRMVSQAGAICDKTMDRRTFQKLLMGTSASEGTSTWTSNTTSGGTLVYTTADLMAASRAKLGLVRAAMVNKVGLDGNPLGNLPRFICVPITREIEAQAICGVNGPGLQAGSQQSAVSMEVVASPWLEASALTGYSTTSYYLLADPNEVTGLVLSEITGFESIQVQPYDAGAVAAINLKLWKPFEVDLFYVTVGSTATVVGAQQGTT